MHDQLQLIENNLEDVSRLARQTLNLLAGPNGKPAPARYLEIMRNFGALQEKWAWQVETERELFPFMLGCERHFAAYLKQAAEENNAVGMLLGSLRATPWPRTPQAGLHSIRPRATHVLNQLLSRVDRERITIMPLLRRWMPEEVAVETASLALTAT